MSGADWCLWALFGLSVGVFFALPVALLRSFLRIANTVVDMDD